jgi:hypothetical protein
MSSTMVAWIASGLRTYKATASTPATSARCESPPRLSTTRRARSNVNAAATSRQTTPNPRAAASESPNRRTVTPSRYR